MVGPVVGVLAAGGVVYATTRSDSVGDAARAVGDATYSAVESADAAARVRMRDTKRYYIIMLYFYIVFCIVRFNVMMLHIIFMSFF